MKRILDFYHKYFFVVLPAVIVVFYVYVIDTQFDHNRELQQQVESSRALLDWMTSEAGNLSPQNSKSEKTTRLTSVAALAHIEQLARKHRLYPQIKNLRPLNNTSLRVWMKEASFNQFIALLDELLAHPALTLHKLSINHQNLPGKVDIDLTLKLAGPA